MTTKKLFSRMFAALLSLVFLFANFTFLSRAEDVIGAERAEVPTVEETKAAFSDDCVLVVLTREASLKFSTYIAEDFSEIECASITDLSDGTAAITREVLSHAVNDLDNKADTVPFETQKKYRHAVSSYKQILRLDLKNPGQANVLAAIETLQRREDVYYAGPNYIMQIEDVGEEVLSPADIGTPNGWAYDIVQMDSAYRFVTDLSAVTVGIMDTGIDGDHPYLQAAINVSLCRDFTSGTTVVTGVPVDDNGHGTEVAGIIAAQGGGGVYSICPMAQIVSLKVAYANKTFAVANVIAAINYATSVGIDVLNASLSTSSMSGGEDQAFITAIANYPGVIVCSAGNDNSNNDTHPIWPCCYPSANIISVGASTEDDRRWINSTSSGSNYGMSSVDVFAPGGMFKTTIIEDINDLGDDETALLEKYRTSYAAPIVTGIAALILAQHPTMSAYEVREAIVYNTDASSDLYGKCVSGGRVNAYKALYSVRNYND